MLRCVVGPVAQLAEHLPFKQRVAGPSPARLTRISGIPSFETGNYWSYRKGSYIVLKKIGAPWGLRSPY